MSTKTRAPRKYRPRTPEADVWTWIKARCGNPRHKYFYNYGGRGIQVCAFIKQSPKSLVATIGLKPTPKHEIDRIDNDGHYSCGKCEECIEHGWQLNVRWLTRIENQRNKRNNRFMTINGKTQTVAAWSEELGIHHNTITVWYDKGLCLEEMIGRWTPRRPTEIKRRESIKALALKGFNKTEIAAQVGCCVATVHNILSK